MKQSSFSILGAVLAAGLLIGLEDTALHACSFKCPSDIGCYGGCEINGFEGCGDACWGGCGQFTCKLIGPGCDFSVNSHCDTEAPPELRADSGTPAAIGRGWAVLQVPASQPTFEGAAERGTPHVVAASTPEFAERAQKVVARQYDDLVPRRTARRPYFTIENRFQYVLQLGERAVGDRATSLESDLAQRWLPFELPPGGALVFRAMTDEAGRIVRVDPLYSRYEELTEGLVSFLRSHLSVRSPKAPRTPVELFGVLGVGGGEKTVWTALSGGVLVAGGRELAKGAAPSR